MNSKSFRQSFIAFHFVLAGVIFYQSLRTFLHAIAAENASVFRSHLVLLSGLEILAALLFVLPKTARVGGIILLLIFAFAVFTHGILNELTLLVYAAGVIMVIVHGHSAK